MIVKEKMIKIAESKSERQEQLNEDVLFASIWAGQGFRTNRSGWNAFYPQDKNKVHVLDHHKGR